MTGSLAEVVTKSLAVDRDGSMFNQAKGKVEEGVGDLTGDQDLNRGPGRPDCPSVLSSPPASRGRGLPRTAGADPGTPPRAAARAT